MCVSLCVCVWAKLSCEAFALSLLAALTATPVASTATPTPNSFELRQLASHSFSCPRNACQLGCVRGGGVPPTATLAPVCSVRLAISLSHALPLSLCHALPTLACALLRFVPKIATARTFWLPLPTSLPPRPTFSFLLYIWPHFLLRLFNKMLLQLFTQILSLSQPIKNYTTNQGTRSPFPSPTLTLFHSLFGAKLNLFLCRSL